MYLSFFNTARSTCTYFGRLSLTTVHGFYHFVFCMFSILLSGMKEIIPLPHVQGGDPDKPVYLKVLSVSPRVFDLVNFFSKEGMSLYGLSGRL